MNTTDTKQAVIDYCTKLGIVYDAEFIPKKQPNENPLQLHWRITLTRQHFTMSCEYRQGMGHVVGYKQFDKTPYDTKRNHEAYKITCETGKLCKLTEDYIRETNKRQPKPHLADVLYCLTSDADVIDYIGFEDWASNFGYDPDSRKTEKIYLQCLSQTRDLLPVVGGPKGLEELQQLFQDY